MKALLRLFKPTFAAQVEQVVGPTYVRADTMAAALDDLRGALGHHVDATAEAVAILGERLNALERRVAALEEAQARPAAAAG